MEQSEIIIVGAGAAGIACASELNKNKIPFLMVEARSRIGGRVLSIDKDTVPIELGAEFIHGASPVLVSWLNQLQEPFYDVSDEHLVLQNKKLVAVDDFWSEIDGLMKKLKSNRKHDRSIEEFLGTVSNRRSKSLFRAFVEGFHAADLELMSEKGLAEDANVDDEEINGASLFRPLRGYGSVLKVILNSFSGYEKIRFNTVIEKIEWEPGHVKLHCIQGPNQDPVQLRCKKLVVTLPIDVLKSEDVQWDPIPDNLTETLQYIQMGHIQKLVFHFRDAFWEKLTEKPMVFLHTSPEFFFPTWWNLRPLHSPLLVAWQGGPKAIELAAVSDEEKVHHALNTLSSLTNKDLSFLNKQLLSWHTHNWSTDPYSKGAYSFVGVDGLEASKSLARPIKNTIFFAGEGTVSGPGRGTVHGALESGARAAKHVLKTISGPRRGPELNY